MSARCWVIAAALLTAIAAPVGGQPPAKSSAADDAKLTAAVAEQFNAMKSAKLDNGLQIYMLPVPNSPVVTTMMAYKVGACDEDQSATGLSHYLEHLLFKGTDK